MSSSTEYRYNRLTWPEMNEAIAVRKVIILPTGSTEQHGRQLPLDADASLVESVHLEAGGLVGPHRRGAGCGAPASCWHRAGDNLTPGPSPLR